MGVSNHNLAHRKSRDSKDSSRTSSKDLVSAAPLCRLVRSMLNAAPAADPRGHPLRYCSSIMLKRWFSAFSLVCVAFALLACKKDDCTEVGRDSNGKPIMRCTSGSKDETAAITVKKYANEAYPQWEREHMGQSCPNGLSDLNEYMNSTETKDPWGNGYKMFCGGALPAGVKRGIAVMSAGPDGKESTSDDIKSW